MRLAVLLPWVASAALAQTAPSLGVFEGQTDIGAVLHAGSGEYDPSAKSYTVTGSGENMWFAGDEFHYVWKKVSGDVALSAAVSILSATGDPHRKAALMIRQSLDRDSAYVDAARHGDGLTSLQFRQEKGANTHEVQSAVVAPSRLRIEKRGDYFYLWVAAAGEDYRFSGGSVRVAMQAPFYVGIAVCAHEKDAVRKALFTEVELGAPATAAPALYSTLETVAVASTDARAVYVTPGAIESPSWAADGSLLFADQDGVKRLAAGGKPAPAGAGAAARGDQESGVSANGQTVYFSAVRDGAMQIWRRRADGSGEEQVTSGPFPKAFPRPSPDGRRLVFLSWDENVSPIRAEAWAEVPPTRLTTLANDPGPWGAWVTLQVLSLEDGKVGVLARFTGGRGSLGAPCWSPDGLRVAFVSYQQAR